MAAPMNQVVAARYVGLNYDLSEADPSNSESWSVELLVAMDVLNVAEANRPFFVRNALIAYQR